MSLGKPTVGSRLSFFQVRFVQTSSVLMSTEQTDRCAPVQLKFCWRERRKKCRSVRIKNCLDSPKTSKLKHQKPFFFPISTTPSVCHRDPRTPQTYFVTLKMRRSRRARNTLIPNDVPGLMVAHTTSKMLPTITCTQHTNNTVMSCWEAPGCWTKCCRRKLGETSWE